jgi:hypothetical protein
MYNMDVSIFGYKIGLEILILIGIIYLILVGHTICGCCNFYSLIEGMEDGSGNMMNCFKGDSDGVIMCTDASGVAVRYMKDPNPVAVKKEGFTGANINYGESSVYNLNNKPIDTSSWGAQNMTIVPGQPVSAGVKAFMARRQQKLPLPEGEMNFFANSDFKPECCPSTFSTSTGCWCGTLEDYNYLINRGGNNVPYSEY